MAPAHTTYGPEDYDPALEADPNEGYRATKLKLFSCWRPHMRSFHFAWLSFFMAFLGWFALAPLMPEIKEDLDLTDGEIWQANITSVAATVLARFIVGPMCDRFGPKNIQCALLIWGAVFTLVGMAINNATSLILIRLLIGIVGSAFVCTQYWATILFTKETAGAAQAVSGGWGNLGGGVTQLFMAGLYTGIRDSGQSRSASWRFALIVPASMLIIVAVLMYFLSDDSPRGDYKTLVASGALAKADVGKAANEAFTEPTAWVLAAQYAGCFGVELTVNNTMTKFFKDKFELSLVTASAIASSFGGMNLFARAIGGVTSDWANKRMGFRGRLIVQMSGLFSEGIMLIIFASMDNLALAIVFLVLFSLSVQSSEGATFAIVPYVNPPATGAVAGVVGAGGNIGAVCWGFIFLFSGMSASDSFRTVGFIVLGLALITPLIFIRGDYPGIFCNLRRTSGEPTYSAVQVKGRADTVAQAEA